MEIRKPVFNLLLVVLLFAGVIMFGNQLSDALNLRLTAKSYESTNFQEIEVCAGIRETLVIEKIDLKVEWDHTTQAVTIVHGKNKISENLVGKSAYLVNFSELTVLVTVMSCSD